MGKRIIKIITFVPILLLCLSLCGCETILGILNDQEYVAENGEKGFYTITNAFEEEYCVEYQERLGLKDLYYDFQVYCSDSKILSYTVKIRDKEKYKPSKMLFLFSAENTDYFYCACDQTDSLYEAIAAYDAKSMKRKEYSFEIDGEEIREILRNGISREELKDKMDSCEYPENILALYDRV